MSNKGQAKVSRRRYNLETIVFRAQQEVTVPVAINIPASTQYLLHPVLVMPADKRTVQVGPGKIRVQGQLEGLLSCVDGDEVVHSLQVPPMEFMAAFTAPALGVGVKIEADAVFEAVEVDRGDDNVANITACVIVSVLVYKQEDTEFVTAVSGESILGETRSIKLQHVIKETETERALKIHLDVGAGVKTVGTDVCIGNLSWQVAEGQLTAEGVAMVRVLYLAGGQMGILEGSQDFELELDFEDQEVSDSNLSCSIAKTQLNVGPEGSGLEVDLTLKIKAVGYREQAGEYLANLVGADSLDQDLHLRNRIGESEYKINLDGTCQFPGDPQSIDVVLPRVRILEVKALDEKVLVRGLLSLNIYYTDESELKRVLVQEEEFSQFLELKGCENGFKVKAWVWPETGICEDERYMVPVLLRVEVEDEMEFNAITDVHVVDVEAIPQNASVILYVAAREDCLFTVARKFNITQEMLREYNGITEIHPGQKLLIPIYQLKAKV